MKLVEVFIYSLFIFQSYNFVIYLVSIFLDYFTQFFQSIVLFYLLKIKKMNWRKKEAKWTVGVCVNAHVVKTFINVNWEVQHVSTLYKHVLSNCYTKVCLNGQSNGIGSMKFLVLRYKEELVTQLFCLWTMLQGILRHLKRRMLWCVILLPM